MFKNAMTLVGTALLAGALARGLVTAATAAPVHAPAHSAGVYAAVAKKAVKLSVKLKTIGKQTVTAKTVPIKPSYTKVGKTRIVSARLSVKQGKQTIAKAKAPVNLEPGTYKVPQLVKYQLASGKKWGKAKTATKTQSLKIGVLPWMSFGEGMRAGHLAKVNAYRKTKGLKPLTYRAPIAKRTYAQMRKYDCNWLEREKAQFSAQGEVAKKAANDTWYEHGFKHSGYRTVAGSETVYYKDFLRKELTKIGVSLYIYYGAKP